MSTTEDRSSDANGTASGGSDDMKLEVIVLPVSDAGRAKEFYGRLGWWLDADRAAEDFRLIQFTPPGSGCSVQFGTNLTSAEPGSAQGLHLIASGELRGWSAGHLHRSAGRGGGRGGSGVQRHRSGVGGAEDRHLHARLRRIQRVPDAAFRRRAADRCLRARARGGEWMQQATLAIRAHVPLEVMSDTIQPFPSFSGIYDAALMALRMQIADLPPPAKPMDAQMASLPE